MEGMTTLSRAQFESAARISTPAEAAALLLCYPHYRTLGDVMHSVSGDPRIKELLVTGFLRWYPESRTDALDRKARNWLSGRCQNLTKEDAFILSHILELPLDKTDALLKMTAGEGIHWRDPEDILWSYAIVHHLEPARTRALLEQAKTFLPAQEPTAATPSQIYTAQVFDQLEAFLYGSEAELLSFLSARRQMLGSFHNTAHHIFSQYMELLEQGFSDSDVEAYFEAMTKQAARKLKAHPEMTGYAAMYQPKSISSLDILETYLHRSLVPTRSNRSEQKSDPFFAIRNSIRQSWPNECMLSRMKSRQIDVSRKVLILLFLATDGSNSAYAESDEEELLSREDIFLDVYTRMNLMLHSCGFPKLDPRNPFDWMVLFCISSGDSWEIDDRLHAMLTEMFPEAS